MVGGMIHGHGLSETTKRNHVQGAIKKHEAGNAGEIPCSLAWLQIQTLRHRSSRQTRHGFSIKEKGDFHSRLLLASSSWMPESVDSKVKR